MFWKKQNLSKKSPRPSLTFPLRDPFQDLAEADEWFQVAAAARRCLAAATCPVSVPTRSQQLHQANNRRKPVPVQPLLRRDNTVCVCVVQQLQPGRVRGPTVTDVDGERGCPPPVRWPTLLHPSFRGPSSPTSPTPTLLRQQISPPWGQPTLSPHPQATLDSFQGCQVDCSMF